MTREEYNDFANALKNNYTIDFDKLSEFCDMAISALSEELSEDGTLTVHVSDGSKVKRVFVMGDNIFGGLYYPDSAENKGKSKHGHWVRMSDLPEDKDDRYKCSRCGNVVHHSNGVNLYTFNSWCGKCGSLNNSLIAGLEPKGEKGTE